MKMKLKLGLVTLSVLLLVAATGFLGPPAHAAPRDRGCIPWYELVDSYGNPLTKGYDEFGYNYGAHMFNGIYSDYDRVHGGLYSDVTLIMKWNDAWLSAYDCNDDGNLDRPASYIGSGAWLTNHQYGTFDVDGRTVHWEYFVKIVALDQPYIDTDSDGLDDNTGGIRIWGSFVIIQSVYNEGYPAGAHGLEFIAQPAGFGVAG